MKKIIILLALSSIITLSWCWSSDTKQISFDSFNIEVANDFNEVDPSIVDWKQIVNKISKSIMKKNKDWFNENIVITNWDLKKNYKVQDLVDVNIQKLKSQIGWYNQWEIWYNDFECKWVTINWAYNTFDVPESISSKDSKKIYIIQYYFIYNNKNYTLSASTQTQDSIDTFKDYFKSITCK